jgi:hypothetical protein
MKRIAALVIALLLVVGLAAEARAALSGLYTCVALQGLAGGGTGILPIIIHYNPTNAAQSIRRVRVFDSAGALNFDSGPIPAGATVVPPRGSFPIVIVTGAFEGARYVINWSQSVNGAAPIPRLDLMLIDPTLTFPTSVAQSNCP